MEKKYPILITIPHGAASVPEELAEYISLSDFELFTGADTCADEIFSFNNALAVLKGRINGIILDLDRNLKTIGSQFNGILNRKSPNGRSIYTEGHFPDELAVSAIIERYYIPFHDALSKILKTEEIMLILDCHTVDAVAPPSSSDAGEPRPVVSILNHLETREGTVKTADSDKTDTLRSLLSDVLAPFGKSVTSDDGKRVIPSESAIASRCFSAGIPFIRIEVSKSIFLNEEFFSFEYLKVDELRLKKLRSIIWKSISSWYDEY